MMPAGAITNDIDVTQLVLALFFLFFAGLIVYLRREDKREGYPLEDPAGIRPLVGFPEPPPPKVFELMEGGTAEMPHHDSSLLVEGAPAHDAPGSPLVPVGNPLLYSIGPASYALRKEKPMIYLPDEIQTLPMRELEEWHVAEGDLDPRGLEVLGADGRVAGVVKDLWIDRSVKILRYLEIELSVAPKTILMPMYHADFKRRKRRIDVSAARSDQFVDAPVLKDPNRITAREEDMVNAFFAGARFWRGFPRQVDFQ